MYTQHIFYMQILPDKNYINACTADTIDKVMWKIKNLQAIV